MEPGKESVACDYYVIFTGSRKRHFILDMLDKYFKHVLLVRMSKGKTMWLILNPLGGNIVVDSVPVSMAPSISELFPNDVIVKYRSKTQQDIPLRIWNINCVEIAKRVLGIKCWKVITPYQLFKYITKKGEK